MVPKFQVATACFPCSLPSLSLSKSSPLTYRPQEDVAKLRASTFNRSIKFQASNSLQSNFFTLMLLLSEGRGGKAWKSSTKWHHSHFSYDFSYHFFFCHFLPLFLQLWIRRVTTNSLSRNSFRPPVDRPWRGVTSIGAICLALGDKEFCF